MEQDDTLVKVATYATAVEAHLAKTKLESEDIEAFILDENIVGLNWLYSAAVGGAKVHVRRGDFERARRILENIPDDFSLPTQTPRVTDRRSTRAGNLFASAKKLLSALGLGPRKPK
jgi:Putative prokaryotic signal transducing protein